MKESIQSIIGLINTPSDKAYSRKPYSYAYLRKYPLNIASYEAEEWLPSELTPAELENLHKRVDPSTLKYLDKGEYAEYIPKRYAQEYFKRIKRIQDHDRDTYKQTKYKNKLDVDQLSPWYSSVTVYNQDVIVSTKFIDPKKGKIRGSRGAIKALSPDARKRFKLHLRNIKEGSLRLFVTLTYGADYPTDGKIVKKHLKSMRDWMAKQGVSKGVWFLEFQKRGAPHFHFFIEANHSLTSLKVATAWARRIKNYLPTKESRRKLIAVHQGQVKNGRPCVEPVKKPHALSYYGTKYATKSHQKEVPDEYQNVGRFWGYWGDAKPSFQVNVYRGIYPVQALKSLLMDWRFRWKMAKDGCVTENDMKERQSGTLWGGAQILDELLETAEFCPF
jgi:hypothetical protein